MVSEVWVTACTAGELPPKTMRAFDIGGHRILLANLGGEIRAVAATCTHEVADLSKGFLMGHRITCPLHLSQFDLHTGEPLSPPATEALRVYEVRVEAGLIQVRL